jgi:ABC-type branched-subunit amino acid transport system permease subunit
VLVIVVVIVSNLRRSSTGRKMLAVRSNERAAGAAGVSVSALKLQAFALSSFIAGLGGALLSSSINEVSFDAFSANASIGLITLVYIGGVASIAGAALAGLGAAGGISYVLFSGIPAFREYYVPLTGAILILTVIAQPDGAVPVMQEEWRKLATKYKLRVERRSRSSDELVQKEELVRVG